VTNNDNLDGSWEYYDCCGDLQIGTGVGIEVCVINYCCCDVVGLINGEIVLGDVVEVCDITSCSTLIKIVITKWN
jgi:hypothetical protein